MTSARVGEHASGAEYATGRELDALREKTLERGLTGCASRIAHVGVVFIHGIGSQRKSETLRLWSAPIIALLSDLRMEQQKSTDPVVSSRLRSDRDEQLFVEVDIPSSGKKGAADFRERAHWVFTEAWWADRIAPPGFDIMANWLGPSGAIQRIAETMLKQPNPGGPELPADDPRQRPTRYGIAVRFVLTAASALLLLVYGALRAVSRLVPIGPFKDGLLTRPIDNFMLDWFGDVYVLLADPAQSAEVRSRLSDAIKFLTDSGCTDVVVVAHSGGAIVTYMSIVDAALKLPPVTHLVTLGEGLNLAWRIVGDEAAADKRFERLYGKTWIAQPGMRWDDFWAARDPAPAGSLEFPSVARPPLPPASHKTRNLDSLRGDHGAYWDNDEQFLIPLVRIIDDASGDGSKSRFFRSAQVRESAARKRTQRVAVVGILRDYVALLSSLAVLTGLVFANATYLQSVGRQAVAWLSVIPGVDLITAPIGSLRGALGVSDVIPCDATTLCVPPVGPFNSFLAAVAVGTAVLIALFGAYLYGTSPHADMTKANVQGNRFNLGINIIKTIHMAAATAGLFVIGAILLIGAFGFFTRADAITIMSEGELILFAIGSAVVSTIIVAVNEYRHGVPPPAVPAAPARPKRFRLPDWWKRSESILLTRMSIMLVLVLLLALSPLAAVLLRPDMGQLLIGAACVYLAAALVGAVGSWRWRAWDQRERGEARRENPRTLRRRHIVVQAVGLFAALAAMTFGLAMGISGLPELGLIILIGVCIIGVSIDVLGALPTEIQTGADQIQAMRRNAGANRSAE